MKLYKPNHILDTNRASNNADTIKDIVKNNSKAIRYNKTKKPCKMFIKYLKK